MNTQIIFSNSGESKSYHTLTGEEYELLSRAIFTGFAKHSGDSIVCGGDSIYNSNFVSNNE